MVSSTQITAIVPSGASGSGPIQVTTPGGTATSASNFTVTASPPTISSFSPISGPVGTTVTISGNNFNGATAVAFNGTAVASFTVDSNTQIRATVPTGATSGSISVTTPGGTATSASNFTVTTPPPGNLLLNPGFELAANGVNPDSWTTSSRFTRSNEVVHSGSFAGKLLATDNSSRTIDQTVTNLTAGTTFNFVGWVNIPPTVDAFTFKLKVRWLDATGTLIDVSTVKTYTASTIGWDQATGSVVAPAGTTQAQVEMAFLDLNATIYVDDLVFQQQ